VILEEGALKKK